MDKITKWRGTKISAYDKCVCDAGENSENHPMMCVQSEPSMLSIVKLHYIPYVRNYNPLLIRNCS